MLANCSARTVAQMIAVHRVVFAGLAPIVATPRGLGEVAEAPRAELRD